MVADPERRRSRRYQARLIVHAKFAGLKEVIRGETRDISSHGAYFVIPRTEKIRIGGKVSLEIVVPENFAIANISSPGGTFRIRANGVVVRVLYDGQMDVTRVATSFSRNRLVRDFPASASKEEEEADSNQPTLFLG